MDFKTTYKNQNDYKSFKDFSKAVEEYIHYFNYERIQSKTKWMPPVKYRWHSYVKFANSIKHVSRKLGTYHR